MSYLQYSTFHVQHYKTIRSKVDLEKMLYFETQPFSTRRKRFYGFVISNSPCSNFSKCSRIYMEFIYAVEYYNGRNIEIIGTIKINLLKIQNVEKLR